LQGYHSGLRHLERQQQRRQPYNSGQQIIQRRRARDILGRLGGDEFGLLLFDCPQKHGERLARELLDDIISYRLMFEGQMFSVGASIGTADLSGTTLSVDVAMSAADEACYAAKEQGRGRVVMSPTG